MPSFDGTGPTENDPMNGGRKGGCNPVNINFKGYLDSGFEYNGPFMRPYAPWGERIRYFNWSPFIYDDPPTDITSKIDMLKAEVASMNNTLKMINREIAHLEKRKKISSQTKE